MSRPNDPPAVSVVVAAFTGGAALERCLASLRSWAGSAEHVVATRLRPEAVARLAEQFPGARFVHCAEGTSVFRLRSLGLAEARGRLIALTEDHCAVTPGWLGALEAAHRAGHAVVGGPIDHGPGRTAYEWALYLCEYSQYMPPLPGGPVTALLAANAVYTREALWGCRPVWQDAFYDNEVHDALRAAGHRPYLADAARVYSHLAMPLREAAGHLFAGGRRFGGYRKSRSSPARRLFWVAASPLVPAVWLSRIVRRVAARRPARLLTLALGMPYLACLLVAWAAGEAAGYLAPEPVARPGGQAQAV